MGKIIFAIVAVIVAVTDFILAGIVISKKNRRDNYLAYTFIMAAFVVLFYGASAFTEKYFYVALYSSFYFSSITIMLMCLFFYILHYTGFFDRFVKKMKPLVFVLWGIATADCVIEILNPFKEIAIHYSFNPENIKKWEYSPFLPYDFHLAYCYILIAVVFGTLLFRTIKTPSVYRQKYLTVFGGILFVVFLNGIFLFLPTKNMLDYSVLFYSFISFFIFWSRYLYSKNGMLAKIRQTIFDELEQPVFLFDIDNQLISFNSNGKKLFSDEDKIRTIFDFARICDFPTDVTNCTKNVHFQWIPTNKNTQSIYRVDVKILYDKKGKRKIGTLIVMTDTTLEMDLLTNFYSKNTFETYYRSEHNFEFPVAITICDINKLTQINKNMGQAEGDRAIQILASLMRLYFPSDSYFARLEDANLVAVSPATNTETITECLIAIRNELKTYTDFSQPLEMQSAIAIATEKNPNILDAAETAMFSVKSKKLMDGNSAHSSLLDSLEQTLQESDKTTRAHVQRTRDMGELLGNRLHFSDIQLSQLALLCMLHDIGKLGIPLDILNKPGKLTGAEWDVMKSHVEKGYRIAKASSELEDIADLILHHHESWNGKGYPDGLSQESIPLLSRVIAVVDSYDAMTNDRPYHKAISEREAREEIKRCAGVQFDPRISAAFLDLLEEIRPLKDCPEELGLKKENPFDIDTPRGVTEIFEGKKKNEIINDYIQPIHYSKYRLDTDFNIISVDDSFCELTGYEMEDISTYKLKQTDLIPTEDVADYVKQVQKELSKNGEAYIEHRLVRKDRSLRDVMCFGKLIFDPITNQAVSDILVFDISNTRAYGSLRKSEREIAKRTKERWEYLMRRDSLTGLLNHECFINDVEIELLKYEQKVVLMILDIDYFKKYNDSYGHFSGDKLLSLVSMMLDSSVKELGFAGRLGGDEFGAILKVPVDISDEKIEGYVRNCFDFVINATSSQDNSATISMGAACLSGSVNFKKLYQAADKALYRAKENGRKQYSF